MIATMRRLDGSVKLAGDQKSMDPMAADGKSKFSVPAGTRFDLACQDKRSVEKFLDATITV